MPRLQELSERSRWLFEAVVESVFITAGDEDYVAARVLWEHGLMRGFVWHAAQSAEKYTKAACLMNGLGAKFGHSFTIGLQALAKTFPEVVPTVIEKPANYKYEEQAGEFREKFQLFAKRIETLGTPSSRYLETHLSVSPYDLVKFDVLSKTVRRMTIDLNEYHGDKPARKWLAEDPQKESRPFFSEPHCDETKTLLEKGNFGLALSPKQQPKPNYSMSSSGMVRAHEVDEDVIETARLFASLTKWKEEYFLEQVVIN